MRCKLNLKFLNIKVDWKKLSGRTMFRGTLKAQQTTDQKALEKRALITLLKSFQFD
jgi:hypothetical protein